MTKQNAGVLFFSEFFLGNSQRAETGGHIACIPRGWSNGVCPAGRAAWFTLGLPDGTPTGGGVAGLEGHIEALSHTRETRTERLPVVN